MINIFDETSENYVSPDLYDGINYAGIIHPLILDSIAGSRTASDNPADPSHLPKMPWSTNEYHNKRQPSVRTTSNI